jgi:hypothetical protein
MDNESIGLLRELIRPRTESVATVNVNAGGVGVWLAMTACCVMLAVSILLALEVGHIRQQTREMQHQLNAIYVLAPQLKEIANERRDHPDPSPAP